MCPYPDTFQRKDFSLRFVLAVVVLAIFCAPRPVRAAIYINEFLASVGASPGLPDGDGQAQEWIELYNSGPAAVDLTNWSLTDDRDTPDQWTIPAITLGPGQYLIVFASAKTRAAAGANLHTNFKLRWDGEYLGLFNLNGGVTPVSEFNPNFPEQRIDHSFGRNSAGQWVYYANPTPGAPNGESPLRE